MLFKTRMLETWAIVRVLSFTRISNAIKALLSYVWSRMSNKVILNFKPYAVSIEPTSTCNLKCPECPTGSNSLKRPRGNINMDSFKAMLKQLSPQLIYLNLYVQGEPTMHPQFSDLVKLAHAKKLYTSTSTNGQFITSQLANKIVESGLTRLIFSVDGSTQKSYEKYRIGGQLSKVIDSIKHLNEAKIKQQRNYPLVIIQFLVFEHNKHEIQSIKALSEKLKADKLEIKTAQFNDFSKLSIQPPKSTKYSRYHLKGEMQLKGKMYNHCWRQWHSAVITWDGQFSPCCYDKDAKYTFGNVNKIPVDTLWKGNNSIVFKQQVIKDKKTIDICSNCPEGRRFLS